MRGARIYARKMRFYTLPPHPNPLPQGERELHAANKISYAIALPLQGGGREGVRFNLTTKYHCQRGNALRILLYLFERDAAVKYARAG